MLHTFRISSAGINLRAYHMQRFMRTKLAFTVGLTFDATCSVALFYVRNSFCFFRVKLAPGLIGGAIFTSFPLGRNKHVVAVSASPTELFT